jgi:TonB family protein
VSYKILVIDHDETKVERIQRPLADAGYEVVVATGAEEGMQTLERVQPDLAVIEALLPEKNGSELCQAIKESPQGKSMPVIIMLEEDAEAQAMAKAMDLHGCDMLIDRSIQDQELLELCQGFFEEHNVEAETEAEAPEEPAAETEAPEPAPEQPSDQSDMLLDTYELDSALQKLDSILEEQPEEGADEAAEKGGDFSHIAEDIGTGQPSVEETETSVVEELQQQADGATDLDSRLDSLLAMESSAPPPPTDTEAPVALYEEIETTAPPEEEAAAPPEVEAELESAELEPAAEEQPVVEEPSKEKTLDELFAETAQAEKAAEEPAVYPARSIPFPAAIPETEAEPGFLRKYWWAVAALLAIVLVGAGLWLMPGDAQPEPLVANLASEGGAATEESGTAAASMVSAPAATPTAESEQEPVVVETPPAPKPAAAKPEPKPAPKPVATKPKPKPAVAKPTTPKPEPKPEPVATKPAPKPAAPKPEPKPEPVVAKPAPVPVSAEPEPKPEPVAPQPEEAKPEPKPEPVKATPPPTLHEPETVKLAPAPVEMEQPPADPVFKPPVVINRIEPAYPKKALKRAAGRTIILKLLISESGRIIRVTVDQGVPVPELEAAAVNAVLRWRYRPATEDGVPVKAWTTAEFNF